MNKRKWRFNNGIVKTCSYLYTITMEIERLTESDVRTRNNRNIEKKTVLFIRN